MGLVYITILSIVPMLALLFAALKGFGIHRSRIEPALGNLLAPLGDKGVELTGQLGRLQNPDVVVGEHLRVCRRGRREQPAIAKLVDEVAYDEELAEALDSR